MSTYALLLLAAIHIAPAPAAAAPEMAPSPTDSPARAERFDVSDTALTLLPRSADGRFVVRGALRQGPRASANGRFRLRTSAAPIDDRSATIDP